MAKRLKEKLCQTTLPAKVQYITIKNSAFQPFGWRVVGHSFFQPWCDFFWYRCRVQFLLWNRHSHETCAKKWQKIKILLLKSLLIGVWVEWPFYHSLSCGATNNNSASGYLLCILTSFGESHGTLPQLSRGEIRVANFQPPCEWCKSG